MKINLNTELTLSKSGFLFDHSSGLTFSLNPTGQFIFHKVQDGEDADKILSGLLDEFDVEEVTARKDLDDFYRQLKEMGLAD